jgi:GT2 family glycosyltransferase
MAVPKPAPEPCAAGSSDSLAAPRVVAIVLNWNGGEETATCLASLRDLDGQTPDLLLADNGSKDGSTENMAAVDPSLQVLRFGENLGYAGGNNRAMRHAFGEMGAEWICLLNSDVLATPELLQRLLAAARELELSGEGPVGALGPCLYYRDEPDVVWACGGNIRPTINVTQLVDHGRRQGDLAGVAKERPPLAVDYLPGTCLLVSRRAWEVVGELDEDFFCYLEDADWCLRMREAGFSVFVVPDATAYHALSSSTGGGYSAGRKYMTGVNSVHFLRKHGTWQGWAALFFFDVALWPLVYLRGLLTGRSRAALAKIQGVIAGLRGRHVDAAVAARFARKAT